GGVERRPERAGYRAAGGDRASGLRQPPFGVLLHADGSVQCAILLPHVARDLFQGAETAEHAERKNRDDEQQQHAADQRHAALAQRLGDSRVHGCTPPRAITSMTRWNWIVGGCPGCWASGLVKVRMTRTELTLDQSSPPQGLVSGEHIWSAVR